MSGNFVTTLLEYLNTLSAQRRGEDSLISAFQMTVFLLYLFYISV